MNIVDARKQRDDGIKASVAHADAAEPQWSATALQFIKTFALLHQRFTSVDVREAAYKFGLRKPPTDKAWGHPFRMAATRQFIAKTGEYEQHPERHASPTPVWKSLTYVPNAQASLFEVTQ